MAEQECCRRTRPAPRHRGLPGLKRLSDRTPLRTKLITAVLALVVMALVAISVASVIVLQSYLYTQRDTQLQQAFTRSQQMPRFRVGLGPATAQLPVRRIRAPGGSGLIVAFQNPGDQIQGGNVGTPPPGMKGVRPELSLPELPSGNWAPADHAVLMTVPAQSGGDTWRVIGQTVPVHQREHRQSADRPTCVIAVDLGPVSAEVQRLITVEIIVGAAIVVVIAVVGVGVVRANLRPLDDIELTAGEIAKGHLHHRIPERDPHTEIGSLGRSLNVMLTQIESAFDAQQESERPRTSLRSGCGGSSPTRRTSCARR